MSTRTRDLLGGELKSEWLLSVVGFGWDAEDRANSRVAQRYGGLNVLGGVGLVSQSHSKRGWPYRAMQSA